MRFITALLFLLFVASCSSSCSPKGQVFTSTFAACAKGDIGQAVAGGKTLFDDVVGKIKGNDPALDADLSSLATQFGVDAVVCAAEAAVAALTAPADTGSAGSGAVVTASTVEPTPGIVAAKSWLAKHSSSSGSGK